jgi:formamidopyrimidine-DNA glycosylase
MAELPDLTVFAHMLTRKFKGKVLDKIEVTETRKLNVTAAQLRSAVEGRELTRVAREGKTLQFYFSGGQVLGLHFMLRGELVALENEEPPWFQIMAFHFNSGDGFAVIDLQKLDRPTLQPKPIDVPDALGLDKAYFTALQAKKRTMIKTLLMDQQVMRGISNSYSDEISYHAGVSPFSTANVIPTKQVMKVFESISTVLKKAVNDIEEANRDELKGELKDFMKIHTPALKITTNGETIKTERSAAERPTIRIRRNFLINSNRLILSQIDRQL